MAQPGRVLCGLARTVLAIRPSRADIYGPPEMGKKLLKKLPVFFVTAV